jgi:hypothetical protein
MFLGQRLNSGTKHEWITDAHSKQRVTEAGACSIFLLVKRRRGVMQNSSAIGITPRQDAQAAGRLPGGSIKRMVCVAALLLRIIIFDDLTFSRIKIVVCVAKD